MSGDGRSYRFSHAIVRDPARSVVRGLRSVDHGSPDWERFRIEHRAYVRALEQAGLTVISLGALEEFPDSVFIEDDALCLPEGIVLLQPGAPSRTAEARVLGLDLEGLGFDAIPCACAGFIDGGDILVTDSVVLVGLSERTDRAGFEWLKTVLQPWGYVVRAVRTPDGVLHFKSDCCVLDGSTVLATRRLSEAACFDRFRVLTVPGGEEAAANCVRINDTLLVPAGFPETAGLLAREGYAVETVPVSQANLLDGGLSCMSLRWAKGVSAAPGTAD
jgi:dimethylargininase